MKSFRFDLGQSPGLFNLPSYVKGLILPIGFVEAATDTLHLFKTPFFFFRNVGDLLQYMTTVKLDFALDNRRSLFVFSVDTFLSLSKIYNFSHLAPLFFLLSFTDLLNGHFSG